MSKPTSMSKTDTHGWLNQETIPANSITSMLRVDRRITTGLLSGRARDFAELAPSDQRSARAGDEVAQ